MGFLGYQKMNTKMKAHSVSYPRGVFEEYKKKTSKIGKTTAQMTREMTLAFIEDRLQIECAISKNGKSLYFNPQAK